MIGKQIQRKTKSRSPSSCGSHFKPRLFASPETDCGILERRPLSNSSLSEIDLFPRPVIQPKLKIGATGDRYEQEADQVAEQVMRMPEPCPRCQKGEGPLQAMPFSSQIISLVQRRDTKPEELLQPRGAGEISPLNSDADTRIRSLREGGRPLSSSTLDFFESRIGYDFRQVRMHTDAKAAELARGLNARAFTLENDIVFGPGEYSPDTSRGKRLLSHELIHVVQQGRAHSSAGGRCIYRDISGADPCQRPPSHINSMDDYIALVERAEQAYPGTSSVDMITRIRSTKYSGFPWSSFVRSPSRLGALSPRGPLTDADVQAFACDIVVSMPGSGSTDPSHIIVGMDVRRYPGRSSLAPSGVSAEAATTWAGDVGSAFSEYIAQNNPPSEASNDFQTRINYWNEFSPYHDLMADIDGLAMSANQPAQWSFDESLPLSANLRNFFHPAADRGRNRRFTLFAGVAGIRWTGHGNALRITDYSRTDVIERQIDLFVQGNLPSLPQFLIHSPQSSLSNAVENLRYWGKYNQRNQNRSWFIDRFVNFVIEGLQRENP